MQIVLVSSGKVHLVFLITVGETREMFDPRWAVQPWARKHWLKCHTLCSDPAIQRTVAMHFLKHGTKIAVKLFWRRCGSILKFLLRYEGAMTRFLPPPSYCKQGDGLLHLCWLRHYQLLLWGAHHLDQERKYWFYGKGEDKGLRCNHNPMIYQYGFITSLTSLWLNYSGINFRGYRVYRHCGRQAPLATAPSAPADSHACAKHLYDRTILV